MKRVTLLIALLGFVGLIKADETAVLYKTVWTGNKAISWNTTFVPGVQFYTTDLNLFTEFTNNHSIKIKVNTWGEPTYALRYITTNNWVELNEDSGRWSVADGVLSYAPSAEEVEHIKARGLVLSGKNYKVTAIKIGETSVWTGTEFISWDASIPGEQFQTSTVDVNMFSTLENGNTIYVTVETYGSPTYTFKYRDSGFINEYEIPSGVTISEGVATIAVTDNNLATAIAERGLVITGQAYFVTAISYGEDIDAVTVSSTSTSLDWDNNENMVLSYGDRGELANAYVNDHIRVTYTTAASGNYGLMLKDPDGWVDLETGISSTSPTYSANPQTFDYQLTDAAIQQIVKNRGIIIQGKNVTVSSVQLLKPTDRYDVRPVTISSVGTATYSNDCNLDFSATGVNVYYASSCSEGTVTLTQVDNATTWNEQGYILVGDGGTYYPKVIGNDEGTNPSTNYLKPNITSGTIAASTNDTHHYIFAWDGEDSSSVGFYNLTEGHELAANKAYLEISAPLSSPAPMLRLDFGEENNTTSVEAIEQTAPCKKWLENGQLYILRDGVTYDVTGRIIK